MATEAIFDYANATVRLPHLTRKLDDQLNAKKWAEADQTRKEIVTVTEQLGDWLKKQIKAAKS